MALATLTACGGGGGSAGNNSLTSCGSFPEANLPSSGCAAWRNEQTLGEVGHLLGDISGPKIDIDEDGNIFGFYRLQTDAALSGTYSLSYRADTKAWSIVSNLASNVNSDHVAAFIDDGAWLKASVDATNGGAPYAFKLEEGAFNASDTTIKSVASTNMIVQMTSVNVDYSGAVLPVYAWVLDPGADYKVCLAYKPTAISASYQHACSDVSSDVTDNASNQAINSLDLAARFNTNTNKLEGAVVFGESATYTDGAPIDLQRLGAYSFTAGNAGVDSHKSTIIASTPDGTRQYANPKIALAAGAGDYFVSFEETVSEQSGVMILDDNLTRLYPLASDAVTNGLISGGSTFDTSRNANLVRASDGDMMLAIFATKDGNERPIIYRFNYTGSDEAGYALDDLGTVQVLLAASAAYTQNGLDMGFDGFGNMIIAYKESVCTIESAGLCSGTYTSKVRVAYYDNDTGFAQSYGDTNILATQSFNNVHPIQFPTDNSPINVAVNTVGQTALIFQERRAPSSGSGAAENTVRVVRLD